MCKMFPLGLYKSIGFGVSSIGVVLGFVRFRDGPWEGSVGAKAKQSSSQSDAMSSAVKTPNWAKRAVKDS